MRKYNFNEHFFDVLNEKSTYWLGFLYADGYVRLKDGKSGELKLKLKDTDKNHIEKFLNHLDCEKPIKCGVDNKSKFILMGTVVCTKLNNDLIHSLLVYVQINHLTKMLLNY